jgi:hypothetical protein
MSYQVSRRKRCPTCTSPKKRGGNGLKHPGFMARCYRHDADTSGVQHYRVERRLHCPSATERSALDCRSCASRPMLMMMWCSRELACPFLPGCAGPYDPGAGLDWLDSRRADRAGHCAEPRPARRQTALVARDIQVFGHAIEAARGPLTSRPVSATSMPDFPARGPLWPDTSHLPFRAALRLRST